MLRENSHLTPLGSERWPIPQMLSYASESLFPGKLMVLIIRKTCCTSYGEIITTVNIANLQNGGRRLQIILFSWAYSAHHQRDILGLLPLNPHLTPLRPKIWPNSNILSHASEPLFSGSLVMLIIRNNILDFLRWNPYLNLLRPKDGYFSKSCFSPPNHHF